MTDEEIIALYFDRSESAIIETELKYGKTLLAKAQKFVSYEDAMECVNDTYLSAWNNIPPNKPVYLGAWLIKVCSNFTFMKIRWDNAQKRKAEVVELTNEMEECIPDKNIEALENSKEIGKAISKYLRTLTKEKRGMFIRRYFFGDNISEIAARYNCTEGKVKITLHRIRPSLKAYLEKEGITV